MKPYAVGVYDCAGPFQEWRFSTWGAARDQARMAQRYWGTAKVVRVWNEDKVDLGNDGLTEREREELP